MKGLLLLILSLTVAGFSVKAQNTGLYGKRNYIELNTVGYIPVLHSLFESDRFYKKMGSNGLSLGNDLFNYGLRIALGHAGKKRAGIGLELGYDFFSISSPESYINYYTDTVYNYQTSEIISLKMEKMDVTTMSIMPRLEFSTRGGNLPVGINHQLGIGFTSSKVSEKDYRVILQDNFYTSQDSTDFYANLINYDQQYKGFTFLYNFNIRMPVSKSLMINYGIRYTANIRYSKYSFSAQSVNSSISPSRISDAIQEIRGFNVLSFNLGLTYCF